MKPFNLEALYLRAMSVTMHFLSEVLWITPVMAYSTSTKMARILACALQTPVLAMKVANISWASTSCRNTAMAWPEPG